MSKNDTINLRLPKELIEKLDGLARAESAKVGIKITRSAIVRRTLEQAIEQEEKK